MWDAETRKELESAARVTDHVVVSFDSKRTISDLINAVLAELDRQAARIAELEATAKNMHHWLWGVVFEAGGEARVSRRAMASGGPDFRLDCHKSPSSDDFVIRAALAPPTGEEP